MGKAKSQRKSANDFMKNTPKQKNEELYCKSSTNSKSKVQIRRICYRVKKTQATSINVSSCRTPVNERVIQTPTAVIRKAIISHTEAVKVSKLQERHNKCTINLAHAHADIHLPTTSTSSTRKRHMNSITNSCSDNNEPDVDLSFSKRKKGSPCKALLYKNERKIKL